MKQSRRASLLEAVLNTLAGFGISLAAQWFFLPLIGVSISLHQNLVFALIMTVISIARTFVLRRLFEFLHIRVPMSPFMLAVIAERRRQVEVEGWTTAHDDNHKTGELAEAGAAYAQWAARYFYNCDQSPAGDSYPRKPLPSPPVCWPWSLDWWKPRDFRRDLVRAGALIVAEGESFDRSRKQRRPR